MKSKQLKAIQKSSQFSPKKNKPFLSNVHLVSYSLTINSAKVIKNQRLRRNNFIRLYFPIKYWLKGSLTKFFNFCKKMHINSIKFDFHDDFWFEPNNLQKIVNFLKKSSTIKSLKMDLNGFEDCSYEKIQILAQMLKSLRNLTSLLLIFTEAEEFDDESVRFISHSISSLSSLKKLTFDIYYIDSITNESIDNIKFEFKRLHRITDLQFGFTMCHEIDDEGIRSLIEASTKFNLNSLQLCVTNNESTTNWGFNCFKRKLSALRNLKSLVLDFSYCDLSDWSMELLMVEMKKMKGLKSLGVSLHFSGNMTWKAISFVREGILSQPGLATLRFQFLDCDKLKDAELVYVKEALEACKDLEFFELSLDTCVRFTDIGFEELAKGLRKLSKLRYFYFHLSDDDDMTDESLRYLSNAMRNLRNLVRLDLGFQYTLTSDGGIKYLKEAFPYLKNLETLRLNFDVSREMSDNALNHLRDGFFYLSKLKYLKICFRTCRTISDLGMRHVRDGLTYLHRLDTLVIRFSNCYEITDEGVRYLKDGIATLSRLRKLEIWMNMSDEVTEKGLMYLRGGVKGLRNLQLIEIHGGKPSPITKENVESFKVGLRAVAFGYI